MQITMTSSIVRLKGPVCKIFYFNLMFLLVKSQYAAHYYIDKSVYL